jgi:polyhydroxyalkanoate synthesis regulator phasin
MQEAWRAYLDLALGFTEASRKRATKVARKLVGRGGATADQLQSMAEDLVSTSMANRESLIRLVRFELDRALGRVGLATAEEVSQLTTRVRELEEELRVARASEAPAVPAILDDELAATAPPPAKTVRKAVAKKAVAGVPATTAAPTKAAPVKAAPAKAEPAKAAPAKVTATAKAAPAKVTATAKAAPATVTAAQAEPAKATPATVVAKTAVAKKAVAKAPGKVAAKKAAPSKATGAGPAGSQS